MSILAYRQWIQTCAANDTPSGGTPIAEEAGAGPPGGHAAPGQMRRGRHLALSLGCLLVATVFAGPACQELDPDLASGSADNASGAAGAPPSSATGMTGTASAPASGGSSGNAPSAPERGAGAGSEAACETTRAEARAVVQAQCAYCHQAPDNARSVYATGQFNFILELDKITTLKSSVFAGMSYIASGNPAASLIFQRTSNGTMPPASVTHRPSAGDIATLDRWIANCVDGRSAGWPAPSLAVVPDDAGSAEPDGEAEPACGVPGQRCCAANGCGQGGCCVGGVCHGNGATCAAAPAEPGAPAMVGLAGTCRDGSCQTAAGAACGKPSEPCCDLMTCTGAQSSCFTGMTTCSACGDTGQSCCRPNACLEGRACINGGVGRIGTCQLCGGRGQPCCGTGIVALQTCGAGLACAAVAGAGNVCAGIVSDGGSADR